MRRIRIMRKNIMTLLLALMVALTVPSLLPGVFGIETVAEAATAKLSKTSLTLSVGGSKTLKLKGTSSTVKWSSNKKSVATVSSSGKVTAKKKGVATIKATTDDGMTYKCKVTVEAPSINRTSIGLTVGESFRLKMSGTTQTVTWSSNKKSVVSVSSKGKIKAKKAGTATITAKVGGVKYTCKVTVNTAENSTDNDYESLKAYITKNGTVNSEGYRVIKNSYTDEDGVVQTWSAKYNTSTDQVYLKYSYSDLYVDLLVIEVGMYIDSSITTPEVAISVTSSGGSFVAEASFDSSTYNGQDITFTKKSGYTSSNTYLQNMSNVSLQSGFIGWEVLLRQKVGISINDLGFTSYVYPL